MNSYLLTLLEDLNVCFRQDDHLRHDFFDKQILDLKPLLLCFRQDVYFVMAVAQSAFVTDVGNQIVLSSNSDNVTHVQILHWEIYNRRVLLECVPVVLAEPFHSQDEVIREFRNFVAFPRFSDLVKRDAAVFGQKLCYRDLWNDVLLRFISEQRSRWQVEAQEPERNL